MSTSSAAAIGVWFASPTLALDFINRRTVAGPGLATLRERLRLIFGDAAHLRMTPNDPRGTVVEIEMPARP